MSEIRLVRCPKCDKVLPEPPVFTVYQCGGCGALLKAKKKSSGSKKSGDSDKGVEGEERVKEIGEAKKGLNLQEGSFGMDNKSSERFTFGDRGGSKSPVEESDSNELHRGFPKSPMRDRFLNDLSSSPMSSRNVSPSPMRRINNDRFGLRNISKSPVRERGNKSPMSVRTRNVSRSPMRGTTDVNKSPVRTLNEKISNSLDENKDKEQGSGVDFDGEEGVRNDKMTPKTSFNLWLSDDKHDQGPMNENPGRRRKTWRNLDGDEVDKISGRQEHADADDYEITSEDPIHGNVFSKGKIERDPRFRGDYVGGNARPRVNMDQRYTESDGDSVIHRKSRVLVESDRNSASSSSVDGPLSYQMDSVHGYGHSRHRFDTQKGSTNIHYSERVEFIGGSEQQYPSKQFSESDENYLEEEHMRFKGRSMQRFLPDNDMHRRSNFNYGPVLHKREDMYNHPHLYDDPFAGQSNRDHYPELHMHPHRSMMGYVPGRSMDFDQHSLISYHKGDHIDHPSCACSLCEVNDWQGYDRPGPLGYRMPPNRGTRSTSSHSINLQRRVRRAYDPRMAHTGPRERPSQLAHRHASRFMVASQNKRLCLPVAGGSPFVLCHSCSELLKLPGKFSTKNNKEYQLQCGACSCILSFELQKSKIGVLKNPNTAKDYDSGFGEVVNESVLRNLRDSYATSTNLGSYDFDATGNSFQSMESEASAASRRQRLISELDGNTRPFSPSSRSSKEEHISDSASVRSSPRNSSEMPLKIHPPPGSPLRDHLDYSNQYQISGPESVGYYNENEKQVLEKDTSLDSSMVDTAGPSENESDSHELSPSLYDDGDVRREDKEGNKDKLSSKPGFLRGYKSKSGRTSPSKGEVYVNGQLVPFHAVKKAEKLAGPIQPGDYWYDPKAGFWGVMGEPCLGILPPSIQEFSFSMSEGCCGGNTSIYVNGRELHKRDLDILTKRGLPTMRGMRYIIDISGKVLEEQSKDFITDLGKLAPTVEKNKCGFGMQVPEKLNVHTS